MVRSTQTGYGAHHGAEPKTNDHLPRRDDAGYALEGPLVIAPMLEGSSTTRPGQGRALDDEPRVIDARPHGKTRPSSARRRSCRGRRHGVISETGRRVGDAAPGDAANPKVVERATSLTDFERRHTRVPVVSGMLGRRVRADVHSFGRCCWQSARPNETHTAIRAHLQGCDATHRRPLSRGPARLNSCRRMRQASSTSTAGWRPPRRRSYF